MHKKPESVWFLRIYLVEQIQFINQILVYIHVFVYKLLGKGIQEQIYFNNIVRIKSRFFENADMENVEVILKCWAKHWSNSCLGNCQVVSEEHLQQVPYIN